MRSEWVLLSILVSFLSIYPSINSVEAQSIEHPHLFFNNDTIPLIRAKAFDDSINNLGFSSEEIWDKLVIQPANDLLKGPDSWKAPSTLISWTDISRWKERDLVTLSMAHVITGNVTYKEKLKNLTLSLAGWENWTNPCTEHACLDTCHLTMGASLAYDVIYDILNESERNEIRNAIIEKGIIPLYNDSAGMASYHNFFALYTAGIGVSTIAILDEDPRTDEWLNYSINSTIKFFDSQGKYGGTYEGQLYGAYSMDHLVSFMEALLLNNGTNLYEHPFVQNIDRYAIYFTSPDGRTSSNLGDTRDDGLTWSTALSSIASKTNNPYAQWYVAKRKRLENPKWYFYGIMGNLWFNNSIIPVNPESHFPSSYNFQDVGDVAFRTGWDDNDWFLAFKSGVFVGHGHLDHNSFIINLEGTWYLTDPGYRASYNPVLNNFTTGTVGHNTVLVDGNFQTAWRNGSIEKFYTSDYYDYVLGEAGNVYENLNQFSRHLLFVKPKYFLILDDIKSDTSHQYSWLYHTDGSGQITEDSGNHFIEKTLYKILVKQFASTNLTSNITRYPGAETYGPYIETKNQINQDNITSLTVLYPIKKGETDPEINLEPIYYGNNVTGIVIEYYNVSDIMIIKTGDESLTYSTSIGNVSSDAEVLILRNDGKIESFAIQNGTEIVYNNSLIFQSQTRLTANFIDNVTHYKGFVETENSNAIKLYVEEGVVNVFINEIKLDPSQFSYDSETKILTFNSDTAEIIIKYPDTESPQYSDLSHYPDPVIDTNPVYINITWSDNEDLDTIIIFENSTGTWGEHVCDLGTGICSGEILSYSFIVFLGITGSLVSIIIKARKNLNLRGKFEMGLLLIFVIFFVFLFSIILFPETSRDISRILTRLGIIPMAFPPKTFNHEIPASNLDVGEVVWYYSFANDTSGNENTTDVMNFTVLHSPPPPTTTAPSGGDGGSRRITTTTKSTTTVTTVPTITTIGTTTTQPIITTLVTTSTIPELPTTQEIATSLIIFFVITMITISLVYYFISIGKIRIGFGT